MWRRLKGLFGGGNGDEPVEDDGAVTPSQAPPDPIAERLALVDQALAADKVEAALRETRGLLLMAPWERRVLERAARVLEAAGEENLAAGFAEAAAERGADAVLALSRELLALDDAELALGLGRAACRRDARSAAAQAAVADALHALSEHTRAVEHLSAFSGVLEQPELAERLALAAALAGDWKTWGRVAPVLGDDAGAAWVLGVGARARFEADARSAIAEAAEPAGDDAADGEGDGDGAAEAAPVARAVPAPVTAREGMFVRYGVLLVAETPCEGPVDEAELGGWIAGGAAALQLVAPSDTRVGYVGTRSELIARWLASALGTSALPLSARLPEQDLVVAIADDDDLAAVYETRTFAGGGATTWLFQAVKDARRREMPLADVIGAIGEDVELPLGMLDAERATDRLPPKLALTGLEERAGQADEAEIEAITAWASAREELLSLASPPDADARPLFEG
ncbi:MAG: hypothetical protein H6745_13660 [Deltaproteobacteria bacterium]|nr:hypothetical protein [Deltaproteobacteria bacterium]